MVPATDDQPQKTHFLPHHAVIRRDKKTTKVRVVYDASARSRGPSLNDCLHTGPKFNQKILEILLRFRSYPVALVTDIEKAFLMISVSPKVRDVLRFLWFKDAFKEDSDIVKLRFTRVVFGVSPSPFLLNATIQHHLNKYHISHPELVKILTQSIYVDDIVFGADSEEEAYALYVDSKEILKHGSFNLRKFVTNSPTLQKLIDAKEVIPTSKTTAGTDVAVEASEETYAESTLPISTSNSPDEHKVLGVQWNVAQDLLVVSLDGIEATAARLAPTKRNVISLIGQIYDPLGFLSPITIQFKKLMQELCKVKLGWDQPLEGEPLTKWNKLVNDLKASRPLTLPRSYFNSIGDESADYRLYGFCDASITAYAAVVYLVESTRDHTCSSFVASKTRVAPLKVLTIPRLELLSAVLLARFITTTSESLSSRLTLNESRCFTDSQVSLFWIKGTGRDWKPFIQNRVNEIRKLVPAELWYHCPGKENPADIPSRGMTPLDLAVSEVWKNGPTWLKTPINISPLPEEMPDECVAELKSTTREVVHNLLTTPSLAISDVIDIHRFCTSHKLFRTTARVLKFVKLLKKELTSKELTPNDLSHAERTWIINVQSSMMEDQNFPTWKMQFSLFRDDCQVWRCGGRLHHANLMFSSKHPVILPKKHPLSTLIARSAHQRVHHNGVKETLTDIRAKYWVIGGRSLVRSIIHKCVICRRYEGKPFTAPPAPPLPSFCVNKAPPFMYTAVDFAGPLYVKNKGDSSSTKVWICLFTCCVTRAIHLELVADLTTTTFLRCLKRFSARRGLPRRILSDNAKTFKTAARLIKTIFSDKEVKDYLLHAGVEWKFNLEKAPWWGGLFERMIKSTKRCLRKVVGTAKFSYDEMHTAIVEIEAVINSRPLTFLNADDTEEPLTPSHLLVGRRLLSFPDDLTYYAEEDQDFDIGSEALRRRAKHLNSVLNHFWQRWSKEYLLELRERHRQKGTHGTSVTAKPGDVVLVHDPNHPRGFWKVARVEKLITGRDGLVCGASLRLPPKNGRQITLQRPLQLIYPLQIMQSEYPTNSTPPEVTKPENGSAKENQSPPRPKRASASRARDRLKQWSEEILDENADYTSS